MKIAVTGKGGVGKDNVCGNARDVCMRQRGRPVLAADVDPDANLGLALGFSEEELDTIVPISKMRKLVEERTGAGPDNQYLQD
ncbi:MAG: AAA family ATPase [Lachnospiraceae bacterium]